MQILRAAGALAKMSGAALIAAMLAAAGPSQGPKYGTIPGRTIPGTNAAETELGGGVNAFTYWMNLPDGLQVATIVHARPSGLAQMNRKAPDVVFRFSTFMKPGDTQTISVPGLDWGEPPTILIRRVGENVEVTSFNLLIPDKLSATGVRFVPQSERMDGRRALAMVRPVLSQAQSR